jgi:hypothetical protein
LVLPAVKGKAVVTLQLDDDILQWTQIPTHDGYIVLFNKAAFCNIYTKVPSKSILLLFGHDVDTLVAGNECLL